MGETGTPHFEPRPMLHDRVVEVLQTCFDPEIPVNIYELGLIYEVLADEAAGTVQVKMTLTSPMCPVAGSLPPEVENKIRALPGVTGARVDVVWDPPWSPDRMSEAAKLQLNML
jgi:FeS assembly SUF system protein